MCLHARFATRDKRTKFTRGKVLKRNMYAWKGVNEQGYKWNSPPPKEIPTQFQPAISNSGSIVYEKGFHYYQEGKKLSDKVDIIKKDRYSIWDNKQFRVEIHMGLHCAKTRNICSGTYHIRVLIPKGARVWIKDGYIVTTDFIIPEDATIKRSNEL